jgi:hypothetical protein
MTHPARLDGVHEDAARRRGFTVTQRRPSMKKLGMLLAVVGVSFGASAAHADPYGMAGCGLGSLLFSKDNTQFIQILAATTNGFLGTQTFGITSGTSNCVSGGVIKAEREQAAFAEVNFQDLKRNMAAGGGEFLASFSTLLGCEEGAKAELFKLSQDRYERIVPSIETTPLQLVAGVKAQIKADPRLAAACTDARAIARAEGRPTKAANVDVALAKPVAAQANR